MEKYGTYEVFKDEETSEIKREAYTGEPLEKKAEANPKLKKLKDDPEGA